MVDYFWIHKGVLTLDKKSKLDLSLCANLKTHSDNIETFDYLYYLNKTLFISGIKDIFKADDRKVDNRIYHLLNMLNNGKNVFVTTNIDKGLQTYLGITDESVSIYPTFGNSPRLINYLHGRIDSEGTWIFTRPQYDDAYVNKKPPCMSFLKYIFENYNVLFIGYGLREDDIKRAISSTNKRKTHYWMESSSRNKEDYLHIRSTALKANYNITLIPYHIDRKGDELLYEVIDSLYKTIYKREGGMV